MQQSTQNAPIPETVEELRQRVAELEAENTALHYERRDTLKLMDDAVLAKRRADELNERLKKEIVKRERSEQALRASEEKYRNILDTMEEGFCIYELIYNDQGKPVDLIWIQVNPAYEKHTGLKDVIGKRHSELSPETESHWFELYDRVVKTGEALHFENWHQPTGRWYYTFASKVGDADTPQVAVLFSDITERKRREEQQRFLLKLSDALRGESSRDAVANRALRMLSDELQLDRCYVGVYRLAEDRGEFPYQVGNDRVPPVPDIVRLSDFPAALRTAFDRTLAIDDVATTEGLTDTDRQNLNALSLRALVAATLRRGEKNPNWSIVAVSAAPRRWTRSEIALIEEVTERTWTAMERVMAEEAVRASEEKYRTLFDSIDEGYCIIEMIFDDAGDAVDYRFVEVNAAFERQAGMTNVVGRRMLEFVTDIESHWLRNYGSVARTGQPERFAGEYKGLGKWFDVYAFRSETWKDSQIAVLFMDITARKVAEDRLREARDELEVRVAQRTRELAQTNKILSVEIEERKELEKARIGLVQKIVTAQEEERRRISRDLHDQLGQRLTALRLNLTALRSAVNNDGDGETLVQRLVEIADTLDSEVSFLSSELRPTALDDLGLEEAMKTYCAEWSGHFDIPLDFHSNFGSKTRVASEVETHFYRIAQEALNNIAKHAKATHVAVMLEKTADQSVLVVEDDGVGFDPNSSGHARSGHGLGLIGMRERANLIKGQLEIESEAGRGTTIYVKVPDR